MKLRVIQKCPPDQTGFMLLLVEKMPHTIKRLLLVESKYKAAKSKMTANTGFHIQSVHKAVLAVFFLPPTFYPKQSRTVILTEDLVTSIQ